MHKSWKCALNFFCKPCKRRTWKMRLNFTANSFVFGCKNCENEPRTFFVNLIGRIFPNCIWTQQQTASIWTQKSWKCIRKYFCKSRKQSTSKMRLIHSKILRFSMHKSWKCTQNIFCKSWRRRTQRIYLKILENSFVFGCINCENVPGTFL